MATPARWSRLAQPAFRSFVLENTGEAESGVSIHLVDPEYDTGPIVRQCKVPVLRDDSVDDLKARVQAREKEFVVETLAGIATGEIRLAVGAGPR